MAASASSASSCISASWRFGSNSSPTAPKRCRPCEPSTSSSFWAIEWKGVPSTMSPCWRPSSTSSRTPISEPRTPATAASLLTWAAPSIRRRELTYSAWSRLSCSVSSVTLPSSSATRPASAGSEESSPPWAACSNSSAASASKGSTGSSAPWPSAAGVSPVGRTVPSSGFTLRLSVKENPGSPSGRSGSSGVLRSSVITSSPRPRPRPRRRPRRPRPTTTGRLRPRRRRPRPRRPQHPRPASRSRCRRSAGPR